MEAGNGEGWVRRKKEGSVMVAESAIAGHLSDQLRPKHMHYVQAIDIAI